MQIIAVINQKGGVGKTTTAIELAYRLAKEGYKTLLADCDDAGNATSGMGKQKSEQGLYAALKAGDAAPYIVDTDTDGLLLLPSSICSAEGLLMSVEEREYALKRALNGLDGYDYAILDCPPSLGLLAVCALTAADGALIPVQSGYYAVAGLVGLLNTVRLIKKYLNPSLRIEGVLLTLYSPRERISREVEEELKKRLGGAVYPTKIPKNVRLAEACSHGIPAGIYDKNCAGSVAYDSFTKDFLNNRRKNYA